VYQSSSNNLDTVANIETNGTAVGSYTADIGTYSVTGLTESTTYYFNVIVKDEAGNKTAYTTKQVTTDAAPTFSISAIDNQSAAALTVGYATGTQKTKTITVSRTGTGNLTGLRVSLSGTNANDFIIAQPNETTLSSAVPSTTFTVKAQDGLAVGTYNATVSVSADLMIDETFTITQVVYAVEPTMIVSASPGDGYVNITWKPVGMEGYKVFQSTVSGTYGSAVDTVGGSVYSSKITGLVNGTTYFFVVRSIHGGIESQISNEVSRIPQVAAPDVPVLQSAIAGDGHVNLHWNSVVGSKEYQIFSSNTTGSYGAPLATVNGSVYTYDAVGLINGMTYYFVLKASNPGGDSAASNELSAVPQVASPSVPSITSAAAGNGQVRLTWNGVAGSTGYKIYKSTVAGTYAAETTTVSSSVYSYVVPGLINGTTYYFIMKATNPGGDSAASNEVSAVPQVASPSVPSNLSAAAGNGQVRLTWNGVAGSTGYKIYKSTVGGTYAEATTVSGSVYSYEVRGLINGTTYYFIIKATNPGGDSAASNEISATPKTVPAAPTGVTASAGNTQATVSFTAPSDNGGSEITGYEAIALPGNISLSGTSSPITFTGLSNGTTYTFMVKAVNSAGSSEASVASNEVTPRSFSNNGNSGSSGAAAQPTTGIDVLFNGKQEQIGTATTRIMDGQTVTTITFDPKKLVEKLAAEDQKAVITIPVSTASDVIIGEFDGQMVKSMEQKQAVIVIQTDSASYTLPAQQIDINSIIEKLGKSSALQDIKIQLMIAKPTADTVKIVEDTAHKGGFNVVVPPLNFTIKAIFRDSTIEVSQFNVYVERTIAIPDGVDPKQVTTGVVVDPDGSVRHVPTRIVVVANKQFAKVNSLTNSTYAIVWHPVAFKDLENHWAQEVVNDMGSRMVINGVSNDTFAPDQNITRAEFAAMIVRALGLKADNGLSPFKDVQSSAWYNGYVNTALNRSIVTGFENGTFAPEDKITREQAMMMIANAMKITGPQVNLQAQEAGQLLSKFDDGNLASEWARVSIANCLDAGIVTGRNGYQLEPKELISRAEVAALVQRLLHKAGLI
ncbi:fibronectin type III domain-containing protein, partial [Paenibacillus periandrae]|uniref:fibronectin type III domain-containing protein n=1 Tax=Paenibacillus periandrae TaxID=1761741 RepID=UPI001F091820